MFLFGLILIINKLGVVFGLLFWYCCFNVFLNLIIIWVDFFFICLFVCI